MKINTPRLGTFLALLLAAALAVGLLALVETKPAEAAFPGANGKIVFVSNRTTTDNPTGDREIFTMDPENPSGPLTQLTDNTSADYDPAWSADGQEIAFVSERDGDPEIYKMAADGSSEVNLTNNASAQDLSPTWSPDGTKIAFTSNRSGNFEIYVMKPRSEGKRNRPINLTKNSGNDSAPNWSPDGTKIAFHTSRGISSDFEVYKMAADGTDQTPLTENQASDTDPAWSPDGTQIVFASNRDSNNLEIYTMNADATNQTNLTNDSVASDRLPDWQPTAS